MNNQFKKELKEKYGYKKLFLSDKSGYWYEKKLKTKIGFFIFCVDFKNDKPSEIYIAFENEKKEDFSILKIWKFSKNKFEEIEKIYSGLYKVLVLDILF